ncbi:uncharacterized protein CELE_ZC328.8 [Caenorhabditis elegans]|uniref:Uncharacterized protein n=1 Tax=Caenorhabditis elegans TaxID=6239 RepID=A0A2K5ATP5_CAEEL|nr:Uncharacterized protein CELE_ZC328.8 [Caenorhabditis elegans]SPC47146.2 Uncharacterized protein CELE_ZC328.8 [Caenorhabditis elegans]|eukprot:NP_001348694.2 Uncharacterized protein CELE_ZC328.8 [Caenorhabditis elegans]
MTNIRVSVDL